MLVFQIEIIIIEEDVMLGFYLSIVDTEEGKQKFTAVYNLWNRPMYYAALKVTGDTGLAQDALQEAFLYIAKNVAKIDDPASDETKAYLMLTVSSQAKKIMSRQREIINSDLVEASEELVVEDFIFEMFEQEDLTQKIKALPEEYRTPLLLHYGQGFSGREIARMLDMKEPAVRKRIERAKRLLSQLLDETAD